MNPSNTIAAVKVDQKPVVEDGRPVPISLGTRIVTLIVVITPFCGLLAGIAFLWGWGFSWVELGLLLTMYLLTGLGITVGFHRLFTHRAFETNRVVQFLLGVLG